ncbi:MAG: hypothetical protein GX933_04645 [Chloroflexi bacterium]|mgnify:CR=1 FL=1|nr:hypothetical protein [Chloroflexota bacterium]
MPLKLIMTWDILPNHEQEYFDFLVREFIPNMNRLGFELSDAWATLYGEQPQVLIAALLPDEAEAERRLSKPEWLELKEKLQRFILNFSSKLVVARQGFQF